MRNALSAVLAATAMTCVGAASAHANTLLYSFEAGDTPNAVDGFARNGPPVTFTVTSSAVGVTNGLTSALFNSTATSFSGAITSKVDPIFTSTTNTPTAITADISVPVGTVYTGNNAPYLGITIFGTLPDAGAPTGTDAAQFQVLGSSEAPIPFSGGATFFTSTGAISHVSIPLIGYDPAGVAPSATYADALAEGFVPTSFQFFFDKDAALPVTIDNVVAVTPTPEPASLGLAVVGGLALLRRRRA